MVPLPSCPYVFAPQHFTAPAELSAQEKFVQDETCTYPILHVEVDSSHAYPFWHLKRHSEVDGVSLYAPESVGVHAVPSQVCETLVAVFQEAFAGSHEHEPLCELAEQEGAVQLVFQAKFVWHEPLPFIEFTESVPSSQENWKAAESVPFAGEDQKACVQVKDNVQECATVSSVESAYWSHDFSAVRGVWQSALHDVPFQEYQVEHAKEHCPGVSE